MAGGNPFTDDKQDLLQPAIPQSDAAAWHEEDLRSSTAQTTAATAETAVPTRAAAADGQASSQPQPAASGPAGFPPSQPPAAGTVPPEATNPFLVQQQNVSQISPALQEQDSQGPGYPPPYYPAAAGAAGAWGGSSQPGQSQPGGPYGTNSGSSHPYGVSPSYHEATSSMPPYQYQQGTAWTSGYPTDRLDQLSYAPFEQQQAGAAPTKMRCGGLGEMWTLFIVSFIFWPGWYVASVWYCISPKLQADPRQKLPFILNCAMAVLFTLIWVSILARHTWSHNNSTYCDPILGVCV